MNVFYEDEGSLKVGAVLADNAATLQVEAPHGKRSKVKAATVLLRFGEPATGDFLPLAQRVADDIDLDFLWQCSSGEEFGFDALAREYFGRDPSAVEAAGVALKLHGAPIYFYKKGRGRYKAAPEAALKAALASVERKRQQALQKDAYLAQLAQGELPEAFRPLLNALLYRPDRNSVEWKALEEAAIALRTTPVRVIERCGGLPSTRDYHLNRFLFEHFPRGLAFLPPPEESAPSVELPLSDASAFSIDDVSTTEIDDAFSVTRVSDDELRIGIHIAAPGLAFGPGSPMDAIARERLSTAYMPGRKFTMLPEDVICALSLDAGAERPAVSLYLNVDAKDFALRGRHTRLERVRVAANLRHAEHDALNAAFEGGRKGGAIGLPFEEELHDLWRFALVQEARRGKPSVNVANVDYVFRVEASRVAIEARKRGAPLDKLVSELMILANTSWGEILAERDVAAIYRVQASGKVRMSVYPETHEGLGVSTYAWFSSPLRRYVDLINQWQLVASTRGQRAPFARNSEALLAALRTYEVTAARYDEYQRAMEQYWCLRWLQQEQVTEADGTVLRENLVRLDRLPLVLRVPSMPELEAGAAVRLSLEQPDLIERHVHGVWRPGAGQKTP